MYVITTLLDFSTQYLISCKTIISKMLNIIAQYILVVFYIAKASILKIHGRSLLSSSFSSSCEELHLNNNKIYLNWFYWWLMACILLYLFELSYSLVQGYIFVSYAVMLVNYPERKFKCCLLVKKGRKL